MPALLNRRALIVGGVATVVGRPVTIPVLPLTAAVAHGPNGLDSLDLPRLDLSLSAVAYDGVPRQIEAGRYLVRISVQDDVAAYTGTEFISPPSGMSALEFMVVMGLVVFEAIPVPTPAEGVEGFPGFVYESTFAGGPVGWPGTTASAVVDLFPGEWIVLSDGEGATQPPAVITVTGDMPRTLAEPVADITTTFVDFGIAVEGNLTHGDHLMLLQNHGKEPHFMLLGLGPEKMTDELVANSLEMAPEASVFNLNTDVTMVMLSSTQSIGTRQWVPITFDAGTYVGTCYFPTAGGWQPHIDHGMHTVFTVE